MLKKYFGNRADPTPATADTYRINELARFRILLGGLGASTCMSTFYGFNVISHYMVTRYGFTAQDLTTITTTGIVVGFCTFPAGMLLDYAGPMYVCLQALICNALGTLLFALAFDGKFEGGVVKFSVFCAIMNLGCSTFDTGSLLAVMGSFPRTKGSCVAVMKTLTGIGASVFAVINYGFFPGKYAAYMYFMTAVVIVAGSTAVVFIRFPPYHILNCEKTRLPLEQQLRRRLTEKAYLTQHPPMRRFYYGYTIILLLLTYLTTQSLCGAYVPGMTDEKRMGICIGCCIIVCLMPLVASPLPFLGGMNKKYSAHYPELPEPSSAESEELGENGTGGAVFDNAEKAGNVAVGEAHIAGGYALDDAVDLDNIEVVGSMVKEGGDGVEVQAEGNRAITAAVEQALNARADSTLDPQYQGTFWQNVRGLDIWLCWWNTFATWGCGMVIAFNSAQLYQALNDGEYDIKLNTLYSAFIGIGSALGRMSFGFFESWVSSRPVEGRPVITSAYPVSACCMVFGLIFLLALPLKSRAVIIGFFFDSFGNGFSWASTGVTMRTMFAKDIGKHYNFMYSGAFIAVIALNRFAYGEVYAREAIRQRDAGGTVYPFCAGKKCVTTPFAVLLAVNATAIVGALICHFRYRRFVLRHRAAMKARLYAASEEAAALPDREPETRVGGEAMSSSSA